MRRGRGAAGRRSRDSAHAIRLTRGTQMNDTSSRSRTTRTRGARPRRRAPRANNNLSLKALFSTVSQATALRRAGKTDKALAGMLLTKMMLGSLMESALTGMITCLSLSPRNGDETYLSLKYSGDMAKLLNMPSPQPTRSLEKALAHAKKQHAASAAVVAKGVQGKYQALRQSQVSQWAHTAGVLERLMAPPWPWHADRYGSKRGVERGRG